MKILFLTTHLNMGGITRYLLTLTKGLHNKGHEIFVVSSGGEMESAFMDLDARVLTLNIRTKSELSFKIYATLLPLIRYIRQNQIDIIHAHTRITQVMATILNWFTAVKYVSTCHGYFKPRWFRRRFPCWGSAVVAISGPVAVHLKDDLNVPESKIRMIENGIDIEEFEQIDENFKKKSRGQLGLNKEPVVGMLARLSDVKGQDILIQAMPKIMMDVPHVRLLLFGDGQQKEILLKMVNDLRLQEHVRFYSLIDQRRICFSAIDVFVVPSRQEGLGLSVMEAQACGLPVVASRVGGIVSLIEDGRTGLLVDPENIDQLAGAIICLLKDPSLRQTIGEAAREHARKHYMFEQMVRRTLELYQEQFIS